MKSQYLAAIFALLFTFIANKSLSKTSWRGAINTNWKVPGNWKAEVTTSATDIIIGDANFKGSTELAVKTSSSFDSLSIGGAENSWGSGAGLSSNAEGNFGKKLGGGGVSARQAVKISSFKDGADGKVTIANTGPSPTITALSANICAGGSITITGTNFAGITASGVTIGSTAVSSITSFTSTQIIAVVSTACTGNVKVTTSSGTATSTGTFTCYAIPAPPTVTTPVNYCLNAAASQLTATGTYLTWGSGTISGTAGGSSVLSTLTYVSNSGSNKQTDFTTTAANVEITTVNCYLPAYQAVSGLQLALFNSSGTVIATSSTITTLTNGATAVTISNTFNYTIAVAGNYSIGVTSGYGTIGGDNPTFPITEPTGTINVTGASAPPMATAPYHCFNNIQFIVNNGSIAPTPSTSSTGTTNYLVSQTVSGCVSPQATIAVIVNPLSVGGSVNSNATVCSGTNSGTVYLTGQTGNVVKWQSSTDGGITWTDIANTTTSQTYTNLVQTTMGRAVVQSGVCATANSNPVTITVNPVSVGGTVGTSTSVCTGTNSGTLNLTGNTGSVVNWQYSTNGGSTWTGIANTTTSLSYSNITAATQYRAVVQSGICSSANSSAATITVNPVSVGGAVNSNATVCSGTNSGTLNLTGNTGSVVNWQYSTNGGSTWTDIANTTTSLSYSNLTQSTQYLAVVQSGVCSTANSSAATITVNPVSVGGSVGTSTSVCTGTNSGTLNLTGNTGSVVKWQYSTNGGSTWTDIVNTTSSQNYSNITLTTQYRAVVQSGVCSSTNSTAATVTVNPVSVGGAVNSNATVCSGTNSGTLTLTGNTGSVVKWQYSTNGGSTWTDIANTTTSQTYSNITLTTQYIAVVQSGVCSSANSSAATITVNPVSVGGAVNSSATVCSGTNSGTLTLTGNIGSVVKWQSSINGGTTWTDIANTTTSEAYSNITVTTQYLAVVQSGVCSSANSSAATITVNPVSVGGSVGTSTSVCTGTNSGTLNLTGNTGSVVKWQSSTDGGSTWTDIVNTTSSQTYSNITLTTQYRAVVQSGVCSSANSSAATITVNPVSVGGAVNSNATVCSGSNSGTLNLTGQTGNVVKWQSSADGGTTWTDIANTTTSLLYSNLTQTTQYLAVVQSGVCSSATSSAATITVNSVSVGGAVNSNATVCSGSNSGTVYLTGQTGNVVKWQSSTDGGNTWADIANTTTSQTYSNLAQTAMGRAVVQSGVCASVNSNPVTITVEPTGSWTGSVSTDWNDTRNWLCGLLPTSAINVTIPGEASNYPVISSGIDDANNIIIASGGSLTVGSGTLQISGAISNSGIFDATAGTIEMIGASAQTIDGNSFYNNTINNLIVSNTGSGLSVSSTTSDTLKITGTLTFGNSGSTLYTGDNITLVSNSAATASVGIVGSGNTINGNVTVERYINVGTASGQHAKSWQFLATPTIGQTVKQSWMENGATPVGYGTQITGAGGTAAGFDAYTASPSLKYYTPASNSWVGVTGTGISIYNPEGYMVFVRGDRSVTSVSQPANTTTLRTKGALLTGTLSPISVNPDEYASVGNPYASPVDFTLITKGAAIDDQFYVWDPYLYGSYGVGGYQTLSSANEFKPVPGGTSAYPSGTPYYILQSGQAIFVHSTSNPSYTAPDYNLTFSENSKSNSTSANFSRMSGLTPPPSSRAFFGVSLYTGNTIADGNTVAFDRSFSDNVDGNDALKLINGGENFGLKRDGKLLAIEARSPAVVTDTLYYYMTNLQQQTYQLRFAPVNMVASGLQAFLVDNFLNTSTPVSLSDSSFINITVTSNPASSASGRFDLVFRTLSITPVTFTSISAVQKNADIEVDWSVENETGIRQYEVEESGDGNQFTQVATVAPQNNGSGNYSWLDVNVTPGYHYYRVRSVGIDGQVQYTQIVKVLIGKMDASFSVYPNPIVNGNIHLAFNNEPAGVYGVRLMNSLGQLIFLKIINHGGGNSMEEITPSQTLAKGIYQLEITKPDGNVEVVKLIN